MAGREADLPRRPRTAASSEVFHLPALLLPSAGPSHTLSYLSAPMVALTPPPPACLGARPGRPRGPRRRPACPEEWPRSAPGPTSESLPSPARPAADLVTSLPQIQGPLGITLNYLSSVSKLKLERRVQVFENFSYMPRAEISRVSAFQNTWDKKEIPSLLPCLLSALLWVLILTTL